jgi:hypothetical protein
MDTTINDKQTLRMTNVLSYRKRAEAGAFQIKRQYNRGIVYE